MDTLIPSQPLPLPKSKSYLSMIFISILFATLGYVGYQNWQLQQQVNRLEKLIQVDNASYNFPSPQPSADPTANWKTYIDPAGYFSLKYPPTMVLKNDHQSCESELVLANKDTGFSSKYQGDIVIDVCKIDKAFYPRAAFGNITGKEEKTTLDGKEGFVKTGEATFYKLNSKVQIKRLDFYENGADYVIDLRYIPGNPDFTNTFDQILSTFKFLDNVDESKTYKSEKLPGFSTDAFEITYPFSWQLLEDKSNGWLIVKISKENHTLEIAQIPTDGGVCLFSDSPPFEGPSGDLRNVSYIEIQGAGTFRRYENIQASTSSQKTFGICKKEVNSQYFGSLFKEGIVTYTVPTNYNPKLLKEMDSILATLKPIEKN